MKKALMPGKRCVRCKVLAAQTPDTAAAFTSSGNSHTSVDFPFGGVFSFDHLPRRLFSATFTLGRCLSPHGDAPAVQRTSPNFGRGICGRFTGIPIVWNACRMNCGEYAEDLDDTQGAHNSKFGAGSFTAGRSGRASLPCPGCSGSTAWGGAQYISRRYSSGRLHEPRRVAFAFRLPTNPPTDFEPPNAGLRRFPAADGD